VPQGSPLDPLLFNIYIIYIPDYINCEKVKCFLYADDVGMVFISNDYEELENTISVTTNKFMDWCNINKLSLNMNKVKDINFTYSHKLNINLKLNPLKFLGIILDYSFSWNDHIDCMLSKLNKGIYCLRRIKHNVTEDILLQIYYAYIQSTLNYGIIMWGQSSNAKKIFKIQKRSIRIICGADFKSPCRPLFKKLNILTFPSLYIYNNLIHTHENLHEFALNKSIHNYKTRNSNQLKIIQCKYSRTQRNFKYTNIKLYNKLPNTIRCLPLKQFKNNIRTFLINECFYKIEEFYKAKF